MTTTYLVRKVQTCPECDGVGLVSNPHWQRINAENSAWMEEHTNGRFTDEAQADWGRRIRAQWPYGDPPPEEETCPECEGTGQIETDVDLLAVLRTIKQFDLVGP